MLLRPEEGKVKPDNNFIDFKFGVTTVLRSNFKPQISILSSVNDIRKFIITLRNGHNWTLYFAT
jgi:endoglucanase Acf2